LFEHIAIQQNLKIIAAAAAAAVYGYHYTMPRKAGVSPDLV
jgi:hypothetical protein